MRTLIIALVLVALVGADAEAKKRKKRKRRKAAAAVSFQVGQTCTLKRAVKAFTAGKKKVTFKKGTEVTLVKVTKKWVGLRSSTDVEGSAKLNKAFKKACKPSAAPPPEPEAETAGGEEPPPPVEEIEALPAMPETDVSAHEGGEMAMPESDGGPRDTGAAGIDIPVKKEEKVEPYDALDVLGADGGQSFNVERRERRRLSTNDWLGYGGLALGAVGVVTSGVLIGLSSSKANELRTDIQNYNERPVRTTGEAKDLEDRRNAIAAMDATAIAAGAVGLAAAGAGLYFLFFAGDDESVAWVAPSAGNNAVGLVIGGGF